MKVIPEWQGPILILRLQGALTMQNSDGLVAQFKTHLTSTCQACVFALAELELIDSSGVGALVTCFNEARRRSIPLRLAAVRGQPQMTLKVARTEPFLPVFDTVAQAVAAGATA